jgi:putative ABC transport system permease protein
MKLYQVVLKDVMRRKKRMSYAALGVVIGTMTFVAVLTIALAAQDRINDQLEKYGANLTVLPAISSIDMTLGDLSLGTVTVGENYIDQDKLPQIRQIADGKIREALNIQAEGDIATIAPKLYLTADIKGTSVMLVGIEPEEEQKIKPWWQVQLGEYLDSPMEAVVGATAADLLKFKVGDTITVNGSDLVVTGILGETGSNEDYQVFLPLETLQQLFNKEGVISSIDIRALCNACPVEVIADSINQNITGVRAVAVRQIAHTEMGMLERINRFMYALAGITLIIGAFAVFNTMMASVNERTKDIGIMRAVGASRSQILRIFIYESLITGMVGGILGYGVGTLLAYVIGPLVFENTSISFAPIFIPVSLAVATLIAVAATIYPALRATKVKVADSLRAL